MKTTPFQRLVATLVVVVGLVGYFASKGSVTDSSGDSANDTSYTTASALYCTGLSNSAGGLQGHVTLFNSSAHARSLSITVTSSKGSSTDFTWRLRPSEQRSFDPSSLLKGSSFGVAIQVDGPGIVGEEVAANGSTEAPCSAAGVQQWYGAGFDTSVGSSAYVSVFNPTATPAVLNLVTYSPSGYSAPAPFQGLPVLGHQQVEIDLGSQIVNTVNVGVSASVLRGALVFSGVQQTGSVASFFGGQTELDTAATIPDVTTASGARATVRMCNPGRTDANVVVNVTLKKFPITPQRATISAYHCGNILITPNTAIPAAGYAQLSLESSQPLLASLGLGTNKGLRLTNLPLTSSNFLVGDFAGSGFDRAEIVNPSKDPVTLNLRDLTAGSTLKPTSTVLSGNSRLTVGAIYKGLSTLSGHFITIASSQPVVLVVFLHSSPSGVNPASMP